MSVLTGVDMSEITNKELANLLFGMSECNVLPNTTLRQLKLAAERLAAMPDHIPDAGKMIVRDVEANKTTGEQEPLCFIMKTGINILNDGCGKAHVWKQSVNSDYEVPLYTQPQQPAPDKETIKRYIYEYYYYRNHEHLEYLGPEAVGEEFDRWWDDEGKFLLGNVQQQRAEGVE